MVTMISLPITQDRLRQLALVCRTPNLRINPPDIDIANGWLPLTVTDPVTLSLFTDASAWEFIADCLVGGVAVRHKPPSALHDDNAYELVASPPNGRRGIYMKVALRGDVKKLVGLSFHYERHT